MGHSTIKRCHGLRGTPTHNSWAYMHRRCGSPSGDSWNRYGGRGITVCPRWDDFMAFLEDMGERPPGLTLDRIDSDGHYEPGNCRWVDRTGQARNRKGSVYIEHDGRRLPLVEWAEIHGLPAATVRARYFKAHDRPPRLFRPIVRGAHGGKTLREWAILTGVPSSTISNRLKAGQSLKVALDHPRYSRAAAR